MKRKSLRKKCFERDNFTCQKCKIQDRTGKILEAHHKTPLFLEGKDELENLITLCIDCHYFAPNKKEEFENYLQEEMTVTATTLMKAIKKVREENTNLFEEINILPFSKKLG